MYVSEGGISLAARRQRKLHKQNRICTRIYYNIHGHLTSLLLPPHCAVLILSDHSCSLVVQAQALEDGGQCFDGQLAVFACARARVSARPHKSARERRRCMARARATDLLATAH